MLAGGGGITMFGILVIVFAIGLFWLGRQTHTREVEE